MDLSGYRHVAPTERSLTGPSDSSQAQAEFDRLTAAG
ncbi:hypothetical protein CryarDRAFT_3008 [Cryptosporangium arvum DSM 44712]|uniref:Uncharacterized protein n=1 Tax=Cryptosporangium arvum DSM 44712 TaxID=927661 RepID=A0A010ZXD2_9ACTN|nr:hypothetical protein CryarDRAFT_3008 [Cryptosporangium arvum DSM 44712]